MKKVIVSLLAVAGIAASASAQTYETNGAQLRFEVFNTLTSTWGSSVDVNPGARVEFRVVANYIGTRTDLYAMGEALYQPTISNVDLTGPSVDSVGAFRNGGNGGGYGPGQPGQLSDAEGNQGTALADYGRVGFGGTINAGTAFNTQTAFTHTGGSNGAPPGNWIRIAGSFVTQWPRSLAGPVPPLDVTADDINRILRGISSQQTSEALTPGGAANHREGTSNLVLYRQALILSNQTDIRQLQISTFQEAIRRVGGPTGPAENDDRRYITWQTSPSDTGSGATGHRTTVVLVPGIVNVIPSPASAALLGLGGLLAARRRRA